MKRKVIKQGNESLTITIPISWARQFNIKGGDYLDLISHGGKIILLTSNEKDGSSITINAGNNVKFLQAKLLSAYIDGFDEIRIDFDSLIINDRKGGVVQISDVIEEVVNDMIGMKIMERKEKYYLIKTLVNLRCDNFEEFLKDCFLQLISISEQCNKAIITKNDLLFNEVFKIYKDTIQKCYYGLRLLSKSDDLEQKHKNYAVIHRIIEISNLFRHFCKHYTKQKLNHSTIQALKDTKDLIELLQYAFFNPHKRQEYFEKADQFKINHKSIEIPQNIRENLFNIRETSTFLIKEILCS